MEERKKKKLRKEEREGGRERKGGRGREEKGRKRQHYNMKIDITGKSQLVAVNVKIHLKMASLIIN